MKKYELVPVEAIAADPVKDFARMYGIVNSRATLYRVRALRAFGGVKAGQLGGYVTGGQNLSQTGLCWIHDEALVLDRAKVSGNAQLYDRVVVCNQATVSGSAELRGQVQIHDIAQVMGGARLNDEVSVNGCAIIGGAAQLSNHVKVSGGAEVDGEVKLFDRVNLNGYAKVGGRAELKGAMFLFQEQFTGDARVHGPEDYFSGTIDPKSRILTAFKDEVLGIRIVYNDGTGSLQEWLNVMGSDPECLAMGKLIEARLGVDRRLRPAPRPDSGWGGPTLTLK